MKYKIKKHKKTNGQNTYTLYDGEKIIAECTDFNKLVELKEKSEQKPQPTNKGIKTMKAAQRKQDESIKKLEKIGFRIDGSFFSYEEKIFTMRRNPTAYQSQLIEVDEAGLVCGESLEEFINKIN